MNNDNNMSVNDLTDGKNNTNYLAIDFVSARSPNDSENDFEFKLNYFKNRNKYITVVGDSLMTAELVGNSVDRISYNKALGHDGPSSLLNMLIRH